MSNCTRKRRCSIYVFSSSAASGTSVSFATTIGLFSAQFLLPVFLQNIRGLGALATGILLIPQAIGSVLGSTIGGRLYDKFGARLPAIIGLLITGLLTLKLTGMDVSTSDSELQLILIFRGLGMGMAMMPVMTYAQQDIPPLLQAQASSMSNVCRSVFSGLGTAIFASLLNSFIKFNTATLVQTITPDSGRVLQLLSIIQVYLQQTGMTLDAARQFAIYTIYQLTALRAAVLAFDKAYLVSAIVVLLAIIPAFFLTRRVKKKDNGSHTIPVD